MRVAIDFDTVVASDPTFYSRWAGELSLRGDSVALTCSHRTSGDADEWAYHAGVREVFVLGGGKQHQDILSADIWMTGRPDRVLGKEQVMMLHQKFDRVANPDGYH